MKKILSVLLCVMMVLTLTPTMAFAVESTTVAVIGGNEYTSFADAMTDANAMTGEDVTVDIYDEVEFVDGMELKGGYASITFNGKDTDAKITINQTAGGDYLEAHGKTVAFNDLVLAKANPAWFGNSGHMGNYFSIQGGTVTYTNCVFSNGACTSGGTATYTGCTFNNTSEYGLWVYDDALVTVNGGTVDSKKGIKVYSEDEASVTSTLTVQNATFTANVTAKPAVAIGYAESITLIGNTYNNTTGVLELDSGSDADCEGVTFVAKDTEGNDIASTLTAVDRSNSNAACGVLMDGKIYTSVTTAAAEAESGDTVTLLYETEETVTLPAGVTLDTNGKTAENVTVTVPAATVNGIGYGTLQEALDAAVAGTGNVTVEILKDINLTGVDWSPVTVSAPGYPVVTVNGNNKTITGLNNMLFAGTWAGGSGLIINDLTIKDSNIVNDKDDTAGTVGVGAFVGYPQASAVVTLKNCHLVNSKVEGGHWTGGLIGMAGGYNGNDGPVFMTLTIEGCSVTGSEITGKGSVGGVIGHGACSEWTQVNIIDTTVSGNTITSTGSSTNKAGSVMGTIGAAGHEATANGVAKTGGIAVSAVTSGNTVTSNSTSITTIYGRQGTETGILEVTGGTYEKYPIETGVSYAAPAEGFIIEQNSDGTYGVKPEVTEDNTPIYYPTVTIEKPVIESAENATVTLGILGNTATIAAADGYEIVDVTVNGVSKGAVTSLSGLKTGDKIVVITKTIEPEAPAKTEAELVQEELDDKELVARSKATKSPKGKDAILITWYDKAGAELDFDGVEIFRSTKKNSGYKKVFTSKTDKYYNTAIEEGVKYFYRVRGFVTVDGEKLYTDWSLKAIRTAK